MKLSKKAQAKKVLKLEELASDIPLSVKDRCSLERCFTMLVGTPKTNIEQRYQVMERIEEILFEKVAIKKDETENLEKIFLKIKKV